MIEFLTEIGVKWLEGIWRVSTVAIFLVIISHLALAFREEKLTFEGFREVILTYSRISVVLIVVLGGLTALLGLTNHLPESFLLGEFLAWIYFVYLFYEY